MATSSVAVTYGAVVTYGERATRVQSLPPVWPQLASELTAGG
ncbi:MAG: hypothetical protein OXM03_11680 [Chloroflexota bacterium]|nr:hypothetical protein [Chloroflexota bacterium]MDE2841277.1 hypothetical protein [Chloroflexota bacterium]MDE2930372.1 hypothetical protein [Chloroflexota bacterium]